MLYLAMNIAVIVAQEQSGNMAPGAEGATGIAPTGAGAIGDDLSGLAGLGRRQPWLAWPMTIAMLSLAGNPGTGRLHRQVPADPRARGRQLHVAGDVLVIGSMISLGYYLRVVATIWMRGSEQPAPVARGGLAFAPVAGGSQEADAESLGGRAREAPEVAFVALLFAASSIFFGISPPRCFTSRPTPAGRSAGSSRAVRSARGKHGKPQVPRPPQASSRRPQVSYGGSIVAMPLGSPSPKLAITVDPEVHAGVLAAAAADGVSVSAWITGAARRALLVRDGLRAIAEWEDEHGALTEAELVAARHRLAGTQTDVHVGGA